MISNEEKKYHRSDLAKQQLRTAVILFINDKDLSSVITLSAAASNILYHKSLLVLILKEKHLDSYNYHHIKSQS